MVRFPGNPAVLLHAVDAAVARNAFKKAVGFAQQVLAVDPINMPVRQRMIELQLAHARKQVRSGRADLAAKSLDEASEWERPDKPDPSLRIGRALVAGWRQDGDPATAEAVHAAVQEAGGSPLGWFRMVLEASLMNWPAKRLQPFQRELQAAHTRPNRTAPPSWRWSDCSGNGKSGAAGERSRRRCGCSNRTWPAAVSIDWSPAEFLTIAEMLWRICGDIPPCTVMRRAPWQREAGNLAARFYQLLAGAEGNREALNQRAGERVVQPHGSRPRTRQDFTLFNRVQKLAFGPAERQGHRAACGEPASPRSMSSTRRTWRRLLASLVGEMPSLPAREIRDMVNQLGRESGHRDDGRDALRVGMGEVLSEQQMLQLCAAVGRAGDGQAAAAGAAPMRASARRLLRMSDDPFAVLGVDENAG